MNLKAEEIDSLFNSMLPSKQKPSKYENLAAREAKREVRDQQFCDSYAYYSGNDDFLDIDEDDFDAKHSFFH